MIDRFYALIWLFSLSITIVYFTSIVHFESVFYKFSFCYLRFCFHYGAIQLISHFSFWLVLFLQTFDRKISFTISYCSDSLALWKFDKILEYGKLLNLVFAFLKNRKQSIKKQILKFLDIMLRQKSLKNLPFFNLVKINDFSDNLFYVLKVYVTVGDKKTSTKDLKLELEKINN